jgi:cell division protein FtsQ
VDGRGREPPTLKFPRSPHRRSVLEQRFANLKRFFIRNRLAARSGLTLLAAGALLLGVVLGLPLVALHAAGAVISWVESKAGLTARQLTVDGLKHLRIGDVRQALAIPGRTALYDIDLGAARKRLIGVPWVAEATIRRIPPDRLDVSIKERMAAILWQSERTFYAVDSAGDVIARVDPALFADLFHVAGEGAATAAPALLDALARNPIVSNHVESAAFVGARRWDLHFDNHLVIELPDRGLTDALALVSRMITQEDLLDRDILILDLRDPGAPRLHLNRQAVMKPPAGQAT